MAYFTPDTQAFLRGLAANNDRDWFKANQDRFESAVREPALAFIEDAAGWLEMAGTPYRGEAKKQGGALSKIHRDVRFSKDKTPYHAHMTLHFKHAEQTKSNVRPMVGLRIETDSVGMGGGVWGGDTTTLNRIRDAIVADPDGWRAAKGDLELWGDSLKTAPKGYDKDHPLIADIRRKAFLATPPLPAAALTGDLMGAFQGGVMALTPFLDFLTEALR